MSLIRSIQIYVLPIIFVIGLVGNGLSFAVMTRKSLRGQVASDAMNWIVSLIAFDRFVNVIFPHKAKEWMTLRRSIWMSFSIILLLFLINSQLLFVLSVENRNHTGNGTHYNCGYISTHAYNIFNFIDLACFCVIPFTVITSCNAAIICRVCWMKSRSVENRMTSVTLQLILISLILLICTTPVQVFQLSRDKNVTTENLYVISNFMIYVSNSVNFFVYCLTGTAFRREVKKLLCRNQVEPAPSGTY